MRLSAHQRAAIAEGRRLVELEELIDAVDHESEALLQAICDTRSKDVDDVIASLCVVSKLLQPEDNPVERKIVLRAIEDLRSLVT